MRQNVRTAFETRRTNVVHPSTGYGEPYSQDLRTLVMGLDAMGELNNPLIRELQVNHIFPCDRTINRWRELNRRFGHYRACVRNGGKIGTRLEGNNLILLALYRVAYPKATLAEINAFLYTANFGDPSFNFFSEATLHEAEKKIGLSRKAGSTTAYQALLPVNIQKRWNYWNLVYPLGIADCSRAFMIDLDECGIFVETANRKHGKAYVGVRVKEPGPYSKTEKWNLLLAICGEDGNANNPSRRWRMTWTQGGTTIDKMVDFILQILNDIGVATPGNVYCFTMDNLNSHKHPAVIGLIYAYGHRVCFRAPYYAVDGAIEYVFNSLQGALRARLHEVKDGPSLLVAIGQCIASLYNFAPYFVNVGFIHP